MVCARKWSHADPVLRKRCCRRSRMHAREGPLAFRDRHPQAQRERRMLGAFSGAPSSKAMPILKTLEVPGSPADSPSKRSTGPAERSSCTASKGAPETRTAIGGKSGHGSKDGGGRRGNPRSPRRPSANRSREAEGPPGGVHVSVLRRDGHGRAPPNSVMRGHRRRTARASFERHFTSSNSVSNVVCRTTQLCRNIFC